MGSTSGRPSPHSPADTSSDLRPPSPHPMRRRNERGEGGDETTKRPPRGGRTLGLFENAGKKMTFGNQRAQMPKSKVEAHFCFLFSAFCFAFTASWRGKQKRDFIQPRNGVLTKWGLTADDTDGKKGLRDYGPRDYGPNSRRVRRERKEPKNRSWKMADGRWEMREGRSRGARNLFRRAWGLTAEKRTQRF